MAKLMKSEFVLKNESLLKMIKPQICIKKALNFRRFKIN